MASQEEIRCIATQAAQEAVAQCLLKLGIDADDPTAVIQFQQDLGQLRDMARSFRDLRSKGTAAVMMVILTGLLGALWVGLKAALR